MSTPTDEEQFPDVVDEWGTWFKMPEGEPLMIAIAEWLVAPNGTPPPGYMENGELFMQDAETVHKHAHNIVEALQKDGSEWGVMDTETAVPLYMLGFLVGHAFALLDDHEKNAHEGDD